jgi:carbon-monoxide dehydrogenase small subunit
MWWPADGARAAVGKNHAKTAGNPASPDMANGLTAQNPGSTLVFELFQGNSPSGLQRAGEWIVRPFEMSSAAPENRLSEECPMANLSMTVNGKAVTANVDPRTLLVQFLRENLRLTGTHVGCDTSQCGACVVHLDGKAVKACTTLALSCEGASVTTIEGLANGGALHPMQEAFREHHGLQCGFCTPGMIMAAVDIVNRRGNELDEKTIREDLDGNICRCTGYHNIVKAVAAGAAAMAGGSVKDPVPPRQAAE